MGLFLVAVGSAGVARVLGGAISDGWAALGYLLISGALVALGSLVSGIGLARSVGIAQRVGFVLLGGAIPWIMGAFIGAGANLPFFVIGGAILAIGYAGVGLIALGLGIPRPVADRTS